MSVVAMVNEGKVLAGAAGVSGCEAAVSAGNEVVEVKEVKAVAIERHVKASRSRFALIIYFLCLISRIALEIFFIWLGYNLALHQSGKSGFPAYRLPETIKIPTFNGYTKSTLNTEVTPVRQYSNFFLNENEIPVCSERVVSCVVSDNYRKTNSVIAMLGISCGSVVIGVVEVVWFFNRLFRGTAPGFFDVEEG